MPITLSNQPIEACAFTQPLMRSCYTQYIIFIDQEVTTVLVWYLLSEQSFLVPCIRSRDLNTMAPFLHILFSILVLNTLHVDANNFTCTGDNFCTKTIMNCTNNEDCYLFCDESNCQASVINCPSTNHSCNIFCSNSGYMPCQLMTIS